MIIDTFEMVEPFVAGDWPDWLFQAFKGPRGFAVGKNFISTGIVSVKLPMVALLCDNGTVYIVSPEFEEDARKTAA